MKAKKLLCLVLAVIMCLSVFVGCGSKPVEAKPVETKPAEANTPEAPTAAPVEAELEGEITFWHCFTQGARMEAVEAAAKSFTELHPGVKINIETMSWGDFNTKWNAGITTGDLPDMSVAQGTGEVAEMMNAGVLVPITGAIDAIGRDRFSANALADMTYDSVSYGLPYYSHAQVMWYRSDLLEGANLNVPSTWAEFRDAAKALTKDGVYGAGVSMSPNDLLCTRYLNYYVKSGGGSLLNDDLTANLTSDLAIEGINFWVDIYKTCSPAETINYTVNDHATLFYQGTTAFDFNSGFMISGVSANRPDLLDYVHCAPLPVMKEGDPTYGAETSHIPLVIWKNSEHADVCQAFIEYLFEKDNYLFFLSAVPVGMLPAVSGIADTEEYKANEIRQAHANDEAVILKAVADGRAIGFDHGPSTQAGLLTSQGVIEEMFQDIVTNGTDVAAAAAKAEARLNEIFEVMVG